MSEREEEARAQTMIPADNPIKDATQDTLGRAAVATRFAGEVLAQDVSEGMVVGVLGAWGSGKTSFVNLARQEINERGATILDFNPWMFSGAEQLVATFFVELAAQLKLRPGLGEIGVGLEEYGEAFSGLGWLPFVGSWIERGRLLNKGLSKFLQRQKEGVGQRRAKIERALAALEKPIVVVLDDIDRLATSEVRDVFKLVRLTASFPNVIYIVAFDRLRVELALAEEGVPGRDYLEKILQLAIDLPAVPEHVLSRQIFAALDAALSTIERPGTLDEQAWPDVFMEVIRPLIRNMRDVRRYAVAVRGTVAALDGQIALADLLALEAVRTFLPDVFVKMPGAIAGLTTPAPSFGGADPPILQEQISELVDVAGERGGVLAALVARLFPAAQRHLPRGTHYGADWTKSWLRDRRVAHEEILRLYLERVAGERLEAFREAERAWAVMADEQALDEFLRSLDATALKT
jgi:predicted KAP-like P-loop ATPase